MDPEYHEWLLRDATAAIASLGYGGRQGETMVVVENTSEKATVATYLFVGLDANYSPAIEQNAVFQRVLDYLNDGVAFWKLHGVHYPLLAT